MIALIQRVSEASVSVDKQVIGKIGRGLLAFVAIHRDDEDYDIDWTLEPRARKILSGLGFKDSDMDLPAKSPFTGMTRTTTSRASPSAL